MKKIDIFLAILAGLGVGFLVLGIIEDYQIRIKILRPILLFSFPILSVFALWLSYFLGKKFLFIYQAGKFVIIGIFATLIDLYTFRFLAFLFRSDFALVRNLFKGISFLVATFAKFWGNKFWAFEKKEESALFNEMGKFYLITLLGLLINVGIFSFLVDILGPPRLIPFESWKNLSVILAALFVSIWNFLGYKFIVFKK